jgi:ribonuclease HI
MGGYAFWITSDLGRVKTAAAFKGLLETSHDAEFKCIINSLHVLKRLGWTVTELYINTDSKNVIDAVTKDIPNLPDYAVKNLKAYNDIIQAFKGTKINLKHVKAHKHTRTPRHWVNDWCDKEAKKAAREKIFGKSKI